MKKKQPKISKSCWPAGDDPLMDRYHDKEWGRPVHKDSRHFEFIVLDGFQAGLSWRTVLHKRENFRKAFSGFDPRKIVKYDAKKVRKLKHDAGIIRNRLKILATIKNAKGFLQIQKEYGSFDKFIWQFTGFKTIRNRCRSIKDIKASTQESDAMSLALKARGFTFVGTTICYAYMQAAGMVNDHLTGCRYSKAK